MCAAAAGDARTAWERITADPRERSERQHPLKGTLDRRLINGDAVEQGRSHRRRAALVLHRRQLLRTGSLSPNGGQPSSFFSPEEKLIGRIFMGSTDPFP
jgi:hypothetical protein